MTPPPATISGRLAARIASTARASAPASGAARGTCHTRRSKNSLGPVERLGLHVLRQRERHRARLGRRGEHAHRRQRGRNQLLGPPDPVEVPRDGRERVVHRHVAPRGHLELLQHRIRRMRREDVAGKQQHRQPVDRRERRAGDHVRGARPDRRGARERAEPVPHPRVADGRMHHRLLVPRLVVGQELGALMQRLADPRHVAVAEDPEAPAEERSARRRPARRACAARNRTSACAVVSRKAREPGPEFMGPGSRESPCKRTSRRSTLTRRTPR